MLFDGIYDPIHLLCGLADRKTAYCVAVNGNIAYLAHMLDPEIRVDTALIDAEKKLCAVNGILFGIQHVHLRTAAFEPASGALYRPCNILPRRRIGDTFIKCHRNG